MEFLFTRRSIGSTSMANYDGNGMKPTENELEREPKQMDIVTLQAYCMQETCHFLQNRAYKADYGYELFRRALEQQEQPAWTAMVSAYQNMVAKWVIQHPKFPLTNEDACYFVNRAFERLWRHVALKKGKFSKFNSLPALLQYLKMCVYAAVVDDGLRLPPKEVSFLSIETWPDHERITPPSLATQPDFMPDKDNFWRVIEQHLRTDKERIVIYGYFLHALKPAEIYTTHSSLFTNAKQVSNTKTSVLRRLARIPDFGQQLRDFIDDCKVEVTKQWV